MKTIEIHEHHIRPDLVREASDAIKRGALVAFATDTAWALAADPGQSKAVSRLRDVRSKMRRDHKEQSTLLSLLFGSLSVMGNFVIMDQPQFRLVKRLLPGPYTIVLPASRQVPRQLQSKRKTIGVRMPEHPVALAILEQLDNPVFATTARRGERLLAAAPEIEMVVGNDIDLLIESEPIVPASSTIIDYTSESPVVLRHGKGELEPDWEH